MSSTSKFHCVQLVASGSSTSIKGGRERAEISGPALRHREKTASPQFSEKENSRTFEIPPREEATAPYGRVFLTLFLSGTNKECTRRALANANKGLPHAPFIRDAGLATARRFIDTGAHAASAGVGGRRGRRAFLHGSCDIAFSRNCASNPGADRRAARTPLLLPVPHPQLCDQRSPERARVGRPAFKQKRLHPLPLAPSQRTDPTLS